MTAILLALAAAGSALAFGGVETLAFAPAEFVVVLVAAGNFWRYGLPKISRGIYAILGTLLLIPLIQTIPLPRALIGVLSPVRLSVAEMASKAFVALGGSIPLSVNSYETRVYFLKFICYVLVFLLGFEASKMRRGASGLVTLLIALGVLEAAYGIFQYLSGWQYIFTYAKRTYIYEATGTYINRNHFAGLLEMSIAFVIARVLVVPRTGEASGSGWKQVVASTTSYRKLKDIVFFAIMALGIVFSRSRMGIAGATIGVIVVACALYAKTRKRSALWAAFSILALPLVYAIWIGLTPVVERFEMLEQPEAMEQDRLPVWRETTRLIRDHPIAGTGLGTYRWANLRYQDHSFWGYYEHAHSDYLEFAADLGIPGALLLFGGLWILVIRLARTLRHLDQPDDLALALGCLGAMVAMLLHEITDFNLQIPANAMIFSWIAGTAAGLVIVKKGDRVHKVPLIPRVQEDQASAL